MKCMFDKCYDAVKFTNDSKTFGIYYSEKQNPDLNIHIHDCCEILCCLHGGKNFLIDDRVYDVSDGDLFIINQFEAHKITFDPDKVFARFVMQVHPEFLYASSTEQTDLSHCFYSRGFDCANKISLTDEELKSLCSLFMRLGEDYTFGDDITKNLLATEVLVYVNTLFMLRKSQPRVIGDRAVQKAIEYINKNYSEPISLADVSAEAYVSVNQLCRLFNRYCGTTVSKYITSKRITEAKKLLSSGKSVTDAALMCGFDDYANFIRVFKKHVGTTPGKYGKGGNSAT